MPLSANTLIHFTDTKEKLKSILEENFRVYFCREAVNLKDTVGIFHAPMVSFCDIPLSEIKVHINSYGSYGIGLTKAWGKRNKLNPVVYVESESHLATSFLLALDEFIIKNPSAPYLQPHYVALANVLRYMKNYEGKLTRKSGAIVDYRFSDEREWRYVPAYTDDCDMFILPDEYKDPEKRSNADDRLAKFRLVFEPNDIKYIIINDDSEINEFVEHLRHAKRKYEFADVERLTTRILTTQQIMEDI